MPNTATASIWCCAQARPGRMSLISEPGLIWISGNEAEGAAGSAADSWMTGQYGREPPGNGGKNICDEMKKM